LQDSREIRPKLLLIVGNKKQRKKTTEKPSAQQAEQWSLTISICQRTRKMLATAEKKTNADSRIMGSWFGWESSKAVAMDFGKRG
jgi:hypothetical protein